MTSSYPLPSIAGFDTGATWPTASEYFKYVSIEATTTRASTVMRSIPTSETRTQASMTMPLSSTRSRTSMRLVPPEALSTGIQLLLILLATVLLSTLPGGTGCGPANDQLPAGTPPRRHGLARSRERRETALQVSDLPP